MVDLSGDISYLVLKGSVGTDLGEVSLDSQMLQVLMQLDGQKDLATVGRTLNLTMSSLKGIVTRLVDLNLVQELQGAAPILGGDFIRSLSDELSKAMGPIAEVVLEDEIDAMGENPDRIPQHRAAELINRLANQIPREEKRVPFQQSMVNFLKQIG